MTPREKDQMLKQAMFSLVGNTNFQLFIENLKQMRENAMLDASSDRVVSDKRLLQTYLGEIRAYGDIIATYEDFKTSVEDMSVNQETA